MATLVFCAFRGTCQRSPARLGVTIWTSPGSIRRLPEGATFHFPGGLVPYMRYENVRWLPSAPSLQVATGVAGRSAR